MGGGWLAALRLQAVADRPRAGATQPHSPQPHAPHRMAGQRPPAPAGSPHTKSPHLERRADGGVVHHHHAVQQLAAEPERLRARQPAWWQTVMQTSAAGACHPPVAQQLRWPVLAPKRPPASPPAPLT